MTWLALPWFVLTTTASPARMGFVMATELTALALFGIPSGAVAQRLGARRTMLVSDLARAPLLAAIQTLHLLGALKFPLGFAGTGPALERFGLAPVFLAIGLLATAGLGLRDGRVPPPTGSALAPLGGSAYSTTR